MQNKELSFKWIGTILYQEGSLTEDDKSKIEELCEQKSFYPIFLTNAQIHNFVQIFENVIRPILHNFKSLYHLE